MSTGANVTFSVAATGAAPISYQWYFNNAAISGATSASYALSNVQTSQGGTYTVTLTNPVGSVTSSGALLTVGTVTPPPSPSGGGGGGGGGGGAPSVWFCAALTVLGVSRLCQRRPR